jgi:hypothetical protein
MSDPLDPPQAGPAPETGGGDDYPRRPLPWRRRPPAPTPRDPLRFRAQFVNFMKLGAVSPGLFPARGGCTL